MQSPIDLRVLEQNRPALLLAEVAAWLHNLGKLSEEFIGWQRWRANKNPHYRQYEEFEYQHIVGILVSLMQSQRFNPNIPSKSQAYLRFGSKNDYDVLLSKLRSSINHDFLDSTERSSLADPSIHLPAPLDDRVYAIGDFIEFQAYGWYEPRDYSKGRGIESQKVQVFFDSSKATEILEASHHRASGVEKEGGKGGEQPVSPLYISTAFGCEARVDESVLKAERRRILNEIGSPRARFVETVHDVFALAVGDTRRPINEVTLWDISSAVAAFYKAATAKLTLEKQWTGRDDLKWRILRVAVDGLAFFGQAARLPDLQARQNLLHIALNQVQTLLEETYPIGNEVYRDETGSAFLVPDLSGDDECGTLLKDLLEAEIRQAFAYSSLGGEIVPRITVSQADAHGLNLAGEPAKPAPEPQADPHQVATWWQDKITDVCPVCGLRPQAAPDTKAGKRNVCDVCERRRADRAEEWAGRLDTTIWTDEVADVNGRLALIVGQFDLEHWLDDTLVRTLLVTDPASGSATPKNPSFARLRRVWETTRTFWQSALDAPGPDGKPVLQPAGPRLEIIPQSRERLDLGYFHTYELVLGRVRLSVVWDSDKQRFITCDNLDYLAKPEQLGEPVKQAIEQAIEKGQTLTIKEPAGYGSENKTWGKITVERLSRLDQSEYVPAIPILAEPRTFMALVPANKALVVVQAIKAKYEREMSKVRNRLPLALGVVYFGRRTPLAAALDAGRRMLGKKQVAGGNWQVASVQAASGEHAVKLAVKLENGEREITMRVSTVMGDGQTEDVWYPYWCVEGKPTDRARQFTGPDGEWVHVCNLRPGDQVSFMPSTFDFEYLDTTARRFEVSYDGGQRRGTDKRQRPYLLEEIEQLEQVWQMLKPPESTSQIKGLAALIETKRADWQKPTGDAALALPEDDPFRQLCRDALANTSWRDKKKDFWFLERAALSGMLADALELHLTIAKEGDGARKNKKEAN